eukprot:9937037-Karenia_brevis.AAC.1
MVYTGCDLWQQMEMNAKWHMRSTTANLSTMANFIVRHLKELPLYHMKDTSLPELDETESRPFE